MYMRECGTGLKEDTGCIYGANGRLAVAAAEPGLDLVEYQVNSVGHEGDLRIRGRQRTPSAAGARVGILAAIGIT
jgi:hypothetical protein